LADPSRRSDASYALTGFAWLLLLASLFVPRADDYFHEVPANLLYQYQPYGVILVAALILLIPVTIRALRGSSPAALAVTALWLIATAATVWAATHPGTYPTDEGNLNHQIAPGAVLAVAAAATGLAGALLANVSQRFETRKYQYERRQGAARERPPRNEEANGANVLQYVSELSDEGSRTLAVPGPACPTRNIRSRYPKRPDAKAKPPDLRGRGGPTAVAF